MEKLKTSFEDRPKWYKWAFTNSNIQYSDAFIEINKNIKLSQYNIVEVYLYNKYLDQINPMELQSNMARIQS